MILEILMLFAKWRHSSPSARWWTHCRPLLLLVLVLPLTLACTKGNQDFNFLNGASIEEPIAEEEPTPSPTPTPTPEYGQIGNAAVTYTPSVIDFGNVATNVGTGTQTMTLTNTSSQPVFLTQLSSLTNSHYAVTNVDCPTTTALAANSTCQVEIVFTPIQGGQLDFTIVTKYGPTLGSIEFISTTTVTGFGASEVIFAGLESIDSVRSTSVRLNWTDVEHENGYMYFRMDGANAIYLGSAARNSSSIVVSGLTPSTNYTFRVRAIDVFGSLDSNSVTLSTTTAPPPTLSQVTDRIFLSAAGPLDQGTLYDFDVNNISGASPSDIGMAYSCTFDNYIDGIVSASSDCNTIPGFALHAGFSGTLGNVDGNGMFSWTPTESATYKSYEIKITGSDGGAETHEIFIAQAKRLYKKDNTLLLDYNAAFATGGNPGSNSPATVIWQNINFSSSITFDGTLLGSFLSGWAGNGTPMLSPYRLVFDGISGATASRVNVGTALNSEATPMFSAWIKPTNLSHGSDAHILGNYDGANGWSIIQKANGNIGLRADLLSNYATVVLADSPVGYWRLNETNGATAANLGTAGNAINAGYVNSPTLNQEGPMAGGKSIRLNGSNQYVSVSDNVAIRAWPSGITVELWAKSNSATWNNSGYFVSKRNSFVFHPNAGGKSVNFYVYTNNWYSATFTIPGNITDWHHWVGTFDGSVIRLYVDGQQVATTNHTGTIASDSGPMVFGWDDGQAGRYFDGSIAEVAVYPTALSAPTILQHYNEGMTSCNLAGYEAWQHLAGFFDGSNARIYRNGSLACTVMVQNISGSTENFTLAAKNDGTEAWPGELSTLRVYNSGSGTIISDNFEATVSNFGYASCLEIYNAGFTTSGVYTLNLPGAGTVPAYCDMTPGNAGWTLIAKGQQGWTWSESGQGSSSDIANNPTSGSVGALSSAAINGLLQTTGKTLNTLTDGVRIRRQRTVSVWQEVRWFYTSLTSWSWALDTTFTVTATIDGVSYGSGNTRDTQWSGGNDFNRIFTWAWASHNNQMGFSYGSSATCVAPLWCFGSENHAIPFTQVYIRN